MIVIPFSLPGNDHVLDFESVRLLSKQLLTISMSPCSLVWSFMLESGL